MRLSEDQNLIVFYNRAPEETTCPLCGDQIHVTEGYVPFVQKAECPAHEARPVCLPCVKQLEPGLFELLDLGRQYSSFCQDMFAAADQGHLDPMQRNSHF